ncbi:hypothetical protein DYB37_008132 [Aphanomyces astaci]|uniref:thioredoxin-disulfide reductase (NADPH) n=1 Tax=Aphanomyces astaci TaxID=112090 RepID=A0A3R7ALH1_APHAT|nr:hypothetical protein DYB37_008132 [Aphanomyces astaci]
MMLRLRASTAMRGLRKSTIAATGLPTSRQLHMKISPAVKEALRIGTPLVALESTIISHGMPFPQNYTMATEVEALIREHGACPATIAILDGEICVGLSTEQLHTLASFGSQATKCSTRDIAAVVARRGTGATTLSRTPVAVVCAGVKSILDIPRTLEFLETYVRVLLQYSSNVALTLSQAVPVVGYQTRAFPAFFTTSSGGAQAHIQLNTPQEVASLIKTSQDLNLPNGFLVAVPNPAPVDSELIHSAIQDGLQECRDEHIAGNAVTPFLLKRVNDVVVVGGAVLDVISKPTTQFIRGTSNIGLTKQTWGGVGRNVAECLHRLDVPVLLVSNIGKDACGHGLLRQLDSLHMDPSGVISSSAHATATYCAVLNSSGDLDVAIADMAILHDLEWDDTAAAKMDTARVVVFDGNLSPAKMARVTRPPQPKSLNPRRLLWFEPTSVEKAVRVTAVLHRVHVVSPNVDELRAMCEALPKDTGRVDQGLAAAAARLLPVDNGPQVIRDVATGPYYVKAASVASSMQHLFPSQVKATIHEHPNKESFVNWLNESQTEFAHQFDNDARPLKHKSSPFCYLEQDDTPKFVGGCDDTLAFFRARTQSAPSAPASSASIHANDTSDADVKYDWDLVVIGGGSGGLACSKEASKLGQKVLVLDYVKPSPVGSTWGLGGTCVNVGCIPKKLMHQSSIIGEILHKDADQFGWSVSNATFDWSKLVSSVQDYIHGLNFKYRVDLRDKKVKYENMLGTFKDAHTLTLTNDAKKKGPTDVTFRRAVIAVGGRPKPLSCPGWEHALSSDDIFSKPDAPGKTLVVGASYVALECAGFLKGQGFDVTIMVRSILLRGFDQDIARRIGEYMESESGIAFIKESVPTSIVKLENGQFQVTHTTGQDVYDTILNATGRSPDVQKLNLDAAGVALNPKSGRIHVVNEQTSTPNIYALGDVIDAPELTPVAIQAGKLLSRRLFGNGTTLMDYTKICTAVFTPVEYGCCGLSEEDAIASAGRENVEVYHQNFTPLEWSLSHDRPLAKECYAKLIVDTTQQKRVLGFHYLGPNAGEVTQAIGIAIKLNATYDDFINTVGIHPTTAEIFTTLEITKESGVDASASGC